jgi:two-component system, cell cycle sensor histidine kinase and response regulator CckA
MAEPKYKRAEDLFKDEKSLYRILMAQSRDGIVLLDQKGKVYEANKRFADMLGYSMEEIHQLHVWDWDAQFTKEQLIEMIRAIDDTGAHFETRQRRKDGTLIDVELSNNGAVYRGQKIIFCICRDNTDRKQAEKALRESEGKHRLLFESAGDAIFIHDMEARILAVNPMASQQLGYSHAKLMSMTVDQVDAPLEAQHVSERIARLREHANLSFETLHRRQDGTTMPVEVSAQRITWDDQPAIMSTCRDITGRKHAEATRKKLEAQNRQLQKAESLSRMAGAIAHHFNNQLTTVMGNLELAMEGSPGGEMPLENLTEAMKAAHRAAEVSRMMLIYLGQTTADKEAVNICEFSRQCLSLLRLTLPATILLATDFPSPGPTIRGNANQIQQVLSNLINNAWEACDGQGLIHISVKTTSAGSIPGSHRYPIDWQPRDTTYACLEVTDPGCGIADKDIEKIFDPFFTSKFPGRGLGLSVVLGILKTHCGAITVESKPGQGSTFRVFLPVLAEAVARSSEKATKTPEVEGRGAVLLVEDEEHVRKMARTMLTRLGFIVFGARDGIEAVEVFRCHRDKIRWVLCDLTMPRMNGWETLEILRSLSPGLPVILASGHDEGQVMAGDHPMRPDAFLHKPFSRKNLAAAIQQILTNK